MERHTEFRGWKTQCCYQSVPPELTYTVDAVPTGLFRYQESNLKTYMEIQRN